MRTIRLLELNRNFPVAASLANAYGGDNTESDTVTEQNKSLVMSSATRIGMD